MFPRQSGRSVRFLLLSPRSQERDSERDIQKMCFQEVGGGYKDWMELVQDRDSWRGTCEYGDELSGSKNEGNFLTSCRTS